MMHRHGRLLGVLAVLLVVLACVAPAYAQEAKAQLSIQEVATEDYPDVKIWVTVPAEMLGEVEPTFVVEENGESADVLAVDGEASATEPVDVVLIVDTSGSMKGESMDTARAAATQFVETLREGSRVAIVAISSNPRVVTALTADKAALKEAISGLEASGETALYDALLVSSELMRTTAANPAGVVVLSDGGDTLSRVSLQDSVDAVARAGVPVFSVSLPSYEADPAALRTVSEQSGGRLVAVTDVAGLPDLYRGLAEEIQDRYVVVYRSAQPRTVDLEIVLTAIAGDLEANGHSVIANPALDMIEPEPESEIVAIAADPVTLVAAVAMVWLSIALLVAGIALFIVRPRTALDHMRYYEQLSGVAGDLPDADDATQEGVRYRMLGAVEYVAGRRGLKQYVAAKLERAGLPLRPVEYMSMHLSLVVITGVVIELLTKSLFIGVLAVVLATVVPMLVIQARARSRTAKFEEQLPDVLNLIAGSLRAGWGMMQAVDMVVKEMLPPASEEFGRVQTEARLGLPLDDAMWSMAERVDSDDFRWTVSAIAIQREVGGNLAEVLDIVASTIRERAALRRHVSALTAEGRLSAYILVGLPFVVVALLYLVNREYITRLFTTSAGITMLGVGVVLMLVGAFWISRAMKVEI